VSLQTITELEQLKKIDPESGVRIHNLNLDYQHITAETVILYDCTGMHVAITARWIIIESGNFVSINAAATDTVDVREASIDRIIMPSGLQTVLVDKANIRHLELGGTQSLHMTKSWVEHLAGNSIEFARLVNCYLCTANSFQKKPVIYARDTAINYTNWPFVDGGPDKRGYRVNVFRGAKTTDSHVVATSYHQLERSEPALVVTAGCRAFTSEEDAIRHWQERRNGMLPLVRKAIDLLEQKEEAPYGTDS
jgi:hypothetical protein